jgi:C-terminal processing protease CtpA/Prc
MKASAVLASILLGPDKDYYTIAPRKATQLLKVYSKKPPLTEDVEPDVQSGRSVLIRTYAEDVRYTGQIAVLANTRTGSEPENLVAAIKTHSRGRIFGSRTQGATHGWSLAVPLPYRFGVVAIPYTRTIMADGKEYEGVGIAPDVEVTNTPADYEHRRDRVLAAAIRYVKASRESR